MSDTANIHQYPHAEPLAVPIVDSARHVVAGACQSTADCRLLFDALGLLTPGRLPDLGSEEFQPSMP